MHKLPGACIGCTCPRRCLPLEVWLEACIWLANDDVAVNASGSMGEVEYRHACMQDTLYLQEELQQSRSGPL